MNDTSRIQRRFPNVVDRRRRYIALKANLASAKILEIGAMDMPTFHVDEAAIFFMDYFSDKEFADLASQNKISRPLENLVHVEYVAKNKYFSSAINNRFDVIIAAHVIEHVADPIGWLRELQSLLTETGCIFLCIPDRRYTFDKLRRESTPLDLLRAFHADAEIPDLYTIADFYYYHRPVSAADCWGDPAELEKKLSKGNYSLNAAVQRAKSLMIAGEVHVNVHAGVFAFPTFTALWDGIRSTGLLHLDLEEVVDAAAGSNEFWALLRRQPSVPNAPRAPSKDRKYVEGKDGVLFLDNDTNSVMDQITGRKPLGDKKLNQWCRLLESRTYLLRNRKSRYVFAIAPTKEAVLQEFLPPHIVVSANRPVEELRRALAASDIVEVRYPIAELSDAGNAHPTYLRGDTHWTRYGAFIAYRAILKDISLELGFELVAPSRLAFAETEILGDLQIHAGRSVPERTIATTITDPFARTIMDNRKPNRGRLVVYENPRAADIRAVIFRDSFAEAMLPFLAETFRRVVIVWNPFVDYDLVAREEPHLVMNIMAERFLMEVPDDNHKFNREDIAILHQINGTPKE